MGCKTRFYMDIMAFNSKVTGSCHLCNVRFPDDTRVKFLVDCGLFQEKETEDYNRKLEFNADSVEFVLITHNHIDHTGRLPLLVKKGYRGPIYASSETANYLMRHALQDSCGVLSETARLRSMAPLYGEEDVAEAICLTQGKDFGKPWYPHKNIKVTFFKNAHVPGAALVLVQVKCQNYRNINVLFTGDYNKKNLFFDAPELPEWVRKLPLTIVQESTYGTTHSNTVETRFEETIARVASERRNILLLAYSFGRTQDVLYKLKCLQQKKLLPDDVRICLDGKLGIRYTKVYPFLDIREDMQDFLPADLQFMDKTSRGTLLLERSPKIIVTSSGTGSFGPAQFYLPEMLKRKRAYIAFTGYTPEQSAGRALQTTEMGEMVKIGGVLAPKFAEVDYFTEFSSHAKKDELLDFLKQFTDLKLVLVNHGDPETKMSYAEEVAKTVKPKKVGILDREYWFRIDPYGFVKSVSTKFA